MVKPLIIDDCLQCEKQDVRCNEVGLCNNCYWRNVNEEKDSMRYIEQNWGFTDKDIGRF